ncbi:MAG TPA: oxygen-independent coproporphyrinogen III oxidase [Chitinophagaceae bacterium]|nr:oxygen-independent coproporphyrinogen III oxidase [Chitinophagaceae bacterium]
MTPSYTVSPALVKKYNQPVPRYTSYPTVPFWKDELTADQWEQRFTQQFEQENAVNGISIYVHLPFCESLCTYCSCNKTITRNHSVEETYLQALETEWMMYRKKMRQAPVIREIHLGGGTPTFFSAANLRRLVLKLVKNSVIHPYYEFSIEGHPNNTTREQLDTLYELGFRRISYGVQDVDEEVQRVINRLQPLSQVQTATDNARAAGFQAVNFDLIYGLPKQQPATMQRTIEQVLTLKPDRIAFYSYAHLPWVSPGQRLFSEADLPSPEVKLQLYLQGKEMLTAAGYKDIGMDHFALPHDTLYQGREKRSLHRNFMGYTTHHTGVLLGLGVSAISDIGIAYSQNQKKLSLYYDSIRLEQFAVQRGHILSEEDQAFRQYILDIICAGETSFDPAHIPLLETRCFPALQEMVSDGLLQLNTEKLQLTAKGFHFVRNICSCFDLHLQGRPQPPVPQFSTSI